MSIDELSPAISVIESGIVRCFCRSCLRTKRMLQIDEWLRFSNTTRSNAAKKNFPSPARSTVFFMDRDDQRYFQTDTELFFGQFHLLHTSTSTITRILIAHHRCNTTAIQGKNLRKDAKYQRWGKRVSFSLNVANYSVKKDGSNEYFSGRICVSITILVL